VESNLSRIFGDDPIDHPIRLKYRYMML